MPSWHFSSPRQWRSVFLDVTSPVWRCFWWFDRPQRGHRSPPKSCSSDGAVDLGTIRENEIAPLFVQILRMFSSWIGDGKQVHVVVVERESVLRTVIKEETLQFAVIISMFPSSPKWSQHPSAFSMVFARILGASSAIWWRAS